MSILVVLNPEASQARRDLQGIRGALADSRLFSGAEVVTSSAWEEGRRAASAAAREGCRMVVAVGGDGTVNSVVNGLMDAEGPRPVLAVIPLGTGNDLARSLGIPAELHPALEELERRIVREMDVLRVTQDDVRYCANVSAGGFSGRVDEDVTGEAKESWGPLAYLRTALAHLPDLVPYDAVLEIDDGQETMEASVFNVVAANARHAAAGVPVAPRALLYDGLMDVVVVGAGPLPKLAMITAQMAAGRHMDHELLTSFRARSLRVSSEPDMWYSVDGELVGSGSTRFDVVPRALPVLVGMNRPSTI